MLKNKNKEKKLKIALVVYTLSSGCLERVVSNMSILFHGMGYEVHLYVLRSELDYPFAGILHQYHIDKYSKLGKIRRYFQLRKSLKQNHFDYIIDHRYRLNFFSEFFWQRFIYKGQNVINYIHSSFITHYLFTSSWLNQLLFGQRTFLSVSKGIEEKLKSQFPQLKTKTIYNPVQLNPENGTPEKQPYILSVARMDSSNVKQIDVLLECYSKSNLPAKGFQLIIIGSGERLPQMKQYADELGIAQHVIFKGFVANPYHYIQKAFYTVLTSRYEGLGMVLIESLMVGTPVISFDCESGPREIITNEENGLLVENQNKTAFIKALNRVIEDEILYQKMKNNSRNSVKKFSNPAIQNEWKSFFNADKQS